MKFLLILLSPRLFTVTTLFWLWTSTALAATYYIDFDNGNDSNTGLTRTSALKTIPGTVTSSTVDTSNVTYLNSSWGPFSNASKVPPGTTFKLRRGTTYNVQDGGFIWIRNDFYQPATALNPILFEADSEWGAGPIIFDAQGMSIAIALFIIQNDGIYFDGKLPGGIDIRNSIYEGIQVKEYPSGLGVLDCAFKNIKFFNNGTSLLTDLAGSGSGQLNLRKVNGCFLDQVEFDGNKSATPFHYINGLLAGDNYKTVQKLVVTNSSAHDHLGDPVDNDSGIGFKILNGQATFRNITSYNNLKGFDLGEQGSNGFDIVYRVLNSTIYNNYWGINFNNDPSTPGVHTANWYLINSLVYNNREGTNAYSGPYNLYLVHNVFANNGVASPVNSWDAWNLRISPDGCQDQTPIHTYLYNNIFYKPLGYANYVNSSVGDGSSGSDTQFNLHSDYNSWVQNSTELFAVLAAYSCQNRATPPNIQYEHKYGANGPGHATGIWYTTEDEPVNGIGHLQADAHSKGTGAADPTLPPFKNAANRDFTLTQAYSGKDLSTLPWYILEMGVDRLGRTRKSWDMGAFEYAPGTIGATPKTPSNLRVAY